MTLNSNTFDFDRQLLKTNGFVNSVKCLML